MSRLAELLGLEDNKKYRHEGGAHGKRWGEIDLKTENGWCHLTLSPKGAIKNELYGTSR